MNRTVKLVAGIAALVVLAGLGLVISRATRAPVAPVADAAITLAATEAEDGGTEPVALPTSPVLTTSKSDPAHVAVDFGYRVGSAVYPYRLALAFAPDTDKGLMQLGATAGAAATRDVVPVDRRWSETRKAYLVAVSRDLGPTVPGLCVRAVLGPSKASFNLTQGSLCVMQRDQDGRCHPSSLACGLLR